MQNYYDEEKQFHMKNRDQAKAPKLGKYWCESCDRSLVTIGAKCPACGVKCATDKRKK